MMAKLGIMLSALLIVTFSMQAMAQQIKPEGIEVTGKGAVFIDPDIFIFSISLADRAMTAGQAKQVVDEKTIELLTMAKAMGIKDKSIETTQMNIRPIFDRNAQQSANLYQPSLIEVSREITFILDDFSHYDPILDKAIHLGVQYISALKYQTSKADSFYRQALDAAIKDAQAKALRIAKKLDLALGKVTHMTEIPFNVPKLIMQDSSVESSSIALSSTPGKYEISAQVSLIYSITR
ncbi:hypothetical protein A9Q98_04500 [Thalassotalea sp. 42_200_T64]|nr:hypothetical protein A9Q98_04500 [Thalassotalea sp. 42_200_T64]